MLKEITFFELRYHLRKPTPYIYFALFFMLAFLAIVTNTLTGGLTAGRIYRNAPQVIISFTAFSTIIGSIAVAAIMGMAIYRELEHKTNAFFFTLPFSAAQFFFGRFLGSFLVVVFIFLGVGLGAALGASMPWLDPETVAPFNPFVFLVGYAVFMLPNLLTISCLLYSLVALTRKITAAYTTGAMILFIVYLLGLVASESLESQQWVALLDPFGDRALELTTKYWTISELNSRNVPITGSILANRALWLGLSLLLLFLTYLKFDYQKFVGVAAKKSRKLETPQLDLVAESADGSIPMVQREFSFRSYFAKMCTGSLIAFKTIVKDRMFISALFAAVVYLFIDAWIQEQRLGTFTYPVTYSMLASKDGLYVFFVYGILNFFSGELIWKERSLRFASIEDTFPVPNWLLYGSKFLALGLIAVLLVAIVLAVGIAVQTLKGYYIYELELYFKELFLITLPHYLLFAVSCFFVHVMVNNKFLASFATLVFWTVLFNLDKIGLNHALIRYGGLPSYIYSDMNGYGLFPKGVLWLSFYWAIFAAALVILGNLMWNRGVETNLRNRFRLAGSRFTKPTRLALSMIIILLASTGSTIYYNTNILNGEALAGDSNAAKVAYEKKYKKYEHAVQPKITDVKIAADLYPEEGKVDIRGRYLLQNKATHAIDSLHVRISGYSIGTIKIGGRVAPPILADPEAGYYIYTLHAPLMPGKQVSFEFDLRRGRNGFSAIRENTDIVENGTFFNNDGFPAFGYSRDVELANNQARRKYGLPTRPRFPDLHDQEARQYSIIGKDADWITFEATVSTIADQIAFAPGTLRKTWMENERRYFHYRTDTTMVNFYPILSGRYEVREDRWRDVKIEIFYHKDHDYNIDRMIKSIKRSLAYYTSNFTPYPHHQIRVIEFPRYVRNAQAFASTIPYSEAIGFLAKIEDGDIDYPFYVMAHEMAHQWWGHQLVGANMQGTALLSETLSEYSAMMVMEKEYGSDTIRRILRFALDDYLKARSAEKEKELPLYRVEFQPYLNYRKGSLAMYALRSYMGEKQLNDVLRAFLEGAAFQGAPYPSALELLSLLKKATPYTLHYVVDDLFKKITLYENRVLAAESQPLASGHYAVKMRLNARKFYADGLGVETETEMADWIDIGIFAEDQTNEGAKEIPIYLRRHKLKSGENTLTLEVPTKPVRVIVDPYYKLIDRNPDDNVASIDAKTKQL